MDLQALVVAFPATRSVAWRGELMVVAGIPRCGARALAVARLGQRDEGLGRRLDAIEGMLRAVCRQTGAGAVDGGAQEAGGAPSPRAARSPRRARKKPAPVKTKAGGGGSGGSSDGELDTQLLPAEVDPTKALVSPLRRSKKTKKRLAQTLPATHDLHLHLLLQPPNQN